MTLKVNEGRTHLDDKRSKREEIRLNKRIKRHKLVVTFLKRNE